MKSKLIKREKDEYSYPCLMVSKDGRVFLFSKKGEATVIYCPTKEANTTAFPELQVGYQQRNYNMEFFTLFEGLITLEN